MKNRTAALIIISLFSFGLLFQLGTEQEQPKVEVQQKKTSENKSPVVPPPDQPQPLCSCQDEPPKLVLSKDESQGPSVVNLQSWLSLLGYNPGPSDGSFGPKTQAAVQLFQQEHKLLATGIVEHNTWLALAKEELLETSASKLKPPSGKVSLLIELDRRKLTVFSQGKPYHEFLVAIGKEETPSPVGDWAITNKSSWGGGFGTRWLGLNVPWGKFGIHGTNKPWSIGSAASHGCFRMWNRDVEVLSSWVKSGTPVKVIHGRFDPLGPTRRRLHKGVRGPDVFFVQKRLRQLGLLKNGIDGIYGAGTQKAVEAFQRQHKLSSHGEVDMATYQALGFHNFE